MTIPPKNPNINKWEGEDEEDDVKVSWHFGDVPPSVQGSIIIFHTYFAYAFAMTGCEVR